MSTFKSRISQVAAMALAAAVLVPGTASASGTHAKGHPRKQARHLAPTKHSKSRKGKRHAATSAATRKRKAAKVRARHKTARKAAHKTVRRAHRKAMKGKSPKHGKR
jgi:RNA-splicing ligase RtcB